MPYPDILDAHVHAAAVHGSVDLVITADQGFAALGKQLDELPYELHSPDSFFCLLDDWASHAVQAVLQKQLSYWKIRSGQFDLCTHLRAAGAPEFAERIHRYLH